MQREVTKTLAFIKRQFHNAMGLRDVTIQLKNPKSYFRTLQNHG